MRSDAARRPARRASLTTTLVAVLLVVGLALVTPAAGPSRGHDHDFLSVHLLFPHHHDAFVPHDAIVGEDGAEDDARMSDRQPAISAAGPLVDGASLAGNGLMMTSLAFMLSLGLLRLAGGAAALAPRQRW